jgi:hypothetical protein
MKESARGFAISPQFLPLWGHRLPKEIAQDPPFRLLEDAFQGRSWSALRRGQTKKVRED